MTRWLLLALAVSACAKGKESAPAPANTTADQTGNAPVASPPPVNADPGEARQAAMEQARNQASLGVSAKTDSFDGDEGGSATTATTKGEKPKTDSESNRRRDDFKPKVAPGPGGPVVGSGDGGTGGTRGDADGTYRAQIVGVKLDGKPAPAALITAIKANAKKVQACYDETLASSPKLVGQLAITFTVLPSGALTAGAVGTSTVKKSALETCVITALQATKLATPLGETEAKVTVSITFKAK